MHTVTWLHARADLTLCQISACVCDRLSAHPSCIGGMRRQHAWGPAAGVRFIQLAHERIFRHTCCLVQKITLQKRQSKGVSNGGETHPQ
jgi:hypothetical protein